MLEDQTSRKAKLAGMVEVAENLKSNSRLPGKRSEMGFCEVWGSVSLFSVASLTFFFSSPIQLAMSSSVAGDKARAARVSSM